MTETGRQSKLKQVEHNIIDLGLNHNIIYYYFREGAPRYDDGLTGDSMSFR